MEKKKRVLFAVNAGISSLAMVFISISLGTEYWIVADLERNVTVENTSVENYDGKFEGYFHAGLFAGEKELDHGFGQREYDVEVECDAGKNRCLYKDPDPAFSDCKATNAPDMAESTASSEDAAEADASFNFGLYLCTIICAVFGLAWGAVAVGFAILNASIRPIEVITGPAGLYVWNSIAAGFCTMSIIFYSVLFAVDLQDNVLEPCDIDTRWSSKDNARLDYSFYLLVVATVLYVANIVVMVMSGIECKRKVTFTATMSTRALDGTMMY